MNSTFGVGFAVGATLSPTVANVFSTVEHKIKSSAQRMESLTAKTKALARRRPCGPTSRPPSACTPRAAARIRSSAKP